MNLSKAEIGKLQKGIKPSALNLGLKQMPTSAMALKQKDFESYLGKVLDKIKDGNTLPDALQTAMEGIKAPDLTSPEAETNIQEKVGQLDQTVEKYTVPPAKEVSEVKNKIEKERSRTPINKYRQQLGDLKQELFDAEFQHSWRDEFGKHHKGFSTYPKEYAYLGVANKQEGIKFIDKLLTDHKFDKNSQNKINRFLKVAQDRRDQEARMIREERFKARELTQQETNSWLNSIDKIKDDTLPKEDAVRDMSKYTDASDTDLYGAVDEQGFNWRTGEYLMNDKGQITTGMLTDAPINAINNLNESLDNFKLTALKFPGLDAEAKANLRALRVNPQIVLENAIDFYTHGLFSQYLKWDDATWDKVINAGELYSKAAPNVLQAKIAQGELPAETMDVLQINEALGQWHLENDTSRKLYKEGFPQSFIKEVDEKIKRFNKTIELKRAGVQMTNNPEEKAKYSKMIKQRQAEITRLEAYKEFLGNIPYFPRYINRQDLEAYIEEKGLKTADSKTLQSYNLKFKKFVGRKLPVQAWAKEFGVPYESNLIKRWIYRSAYSWQKWLLHDYLQEVINEGTFIKPDYEVEGNDQFVDAPSGFDQLFKDQKYREDD
jgi:hypothetical protein